jgi:predicted ABC-type ATPase
LFEAFIRPGGLRFLNADVIARELNLAPDAAAALADSLPQDLAQQRESFAFETVLSDPVGAKISFLKDAELQGYNVVLCFIGISGPDVSEQRVAMRVAQGGHDVPSDKLRRFPAHLSQSASFHPRASACLDFRQ